MLSDTIFWIFKNLKFSLVLILVLIFIFYLFWICNTSILFTVSWLISRKKNVVLSKRQNLISYFHLVLKRFSKMKIIIRIAILALLVPKRQRWRKRSVFWLYSIAYWIPIQQKLTLPVLLEENFWKVYFQKSLNFYLQKLIKTNIFCSVLFFLPFLFLCLF